MLYLSSVLNLFKAYTAYCKIFLFRLTVTPVVGGHYCDCAILNFIKICAMSFKYVMSEKNKNMKKDTKSSD